MSIEKSIKRIKRQLASLSKAREDEEEKTTILFDEILDQIDRDYDKLKKIVKVAKYELAFKRELNREDPTDLDSEEEEDMD